MAGKGSRQRPTDHKKYSEAYDRIFGKKKTVCATCEDRGWTWDDQNNHMIRECPECRGKPNESQ